MARTQAALRSPSLLSGVTEAGGVPAAAGILLAGTAGPDSLVGDADGPVDETLSGEGGADTLLSAAGIDVLDGGPDNDLAIIDRGAALLPLVFVFAGPNLVSTLLGDGTTLTAIENVSIAGGLDHDSLGGGDSFDSLWGGGGNDTLDGGGGSDYLHGDAVTDTTRTVTSGADQLIGGAGNDFLIGDLPGTAHADTLLGGDGSDRLDGGGGADSMVGGQGDDTYAVDDAGDITVEEENGGLGDLVEASISWTLGTGIERLWLTGTADLSGIGNLLDNQITGNAGANILNGAAGNDTLLGGDGQDRLWGGEGNDRLSGQVGDDQLGGAAGQDTLWGDAGRDSLSGGEGDDSLSGGEGDDLMAGDDGADTLNGGTGADTLAGGAGGDTYLIYSASAVISEAVDPSGGTDVARIWVDYVLASGVENLIVSGSAGLSGTGNTLDNALTGNWGNNLLRGMAGADTLAGGLGNDTLVGGNGQDALDGQGGNDLIRYANASEGGDTILGFDGTADQIEVSAAGFGRGLVAGMDLQASGRYREIGADGQATTPAGTGQFLFRTDIAALLWDPDGVGQAAAIPIASFTGLVNWLPTDLVVAA